MTVRSKELTRNRIIRAAIDVFADVDFNQATIRQIAKSAGLSQAAIYKYFESKDQILIAITNDKLVQMWESLQRSLDRVEGTSEKLKKMTWYYLNFMEQNPGIAWMVYVSTNVRTWMESPPAWQYTTGTGKFLEHILVEGQKREKVRRDINFRVIDYLYFGGLRWAIIRWLFSDRNWSLTSVAGDIAETVYIAVKDDSVDKIDFECPYIKKLKSRQGKLQ